jgi:hypothetical protein
VFSKPKLVRGIKPSASAITAVPETAAFVEEVVA